MVNKILLFNLNSIVIIIQNSSVGNLTKIKCEAILEIKGHSFVFAS